MSEPRCTCPTKLDANGAVVRAYLDAACPVHAKPTDVQHCPTCTCGKAPIIQTPEIAADVAARAKP